MIGDGEETEKVTYAGSICQTAEYESDVHTLSLAADFQATEKLKLNASFTYNKAEDDWTWTFVERMSLGEVTINGGTASELNTSTAYDTVYQNNEITEYSNLSYQQYEFVLGATYNVTDNFYLKCSGAYEVLDADEEYVNGLEDGDQLSGYVGLGVTF